jgi:hypothetical protein
MAELIPFPTGPNLMAAKAKVSKRVTEGHSLRKLARFYVDMNHITGPDDIFKEGGRVATTALEFVEQVCDVVGYVTNTTLTVKE